MRVRVGTHRHILAALLTLIVLFGAIPGVVAADTRTGGDVTIAAGETINDNLDIFAGNVVINGVVNGDVNVFSGNVVINGEVTGSVSAFAGTITVNGNVAGDVGAYGGTTTLGPEATVGGDFESGSGSTVVNGQIAGDARIDSESIVLGSTAAIAGNLEYDGELNRAPDATVGGAVTRNAGLGVGPVVETPDTGFFDATLTIYGFLVSFLLGAVLLLVFPKFSGRVSTAATTAPLRSGGVGLLTLIGVPIVLVVLLFTIVGIPLSLAGIFLFAVVLWIGTIYGRFAIGTWLLEFAGYPNRWAALFLGLLVVALAARIPFVGGIISFLVLLLGLGALALTAYRTYRGERTPPEPLVEEPDDTGDSWVPPT